MMQRLAFSVLMLCALLMGPARAQNLPGQFACPANQWMSSIGLAGVPICTSVPGSIALPGYLSGLTIANDNSGANIANDISVAAGNATDSTNAQSITLAAALAQKHVNVAWAAGATAGCLDTGAVGNATYFIFLILQTTGGSNVDVLCSLSPSAPTMPANYTLKRRIGAVIRAAAANVLFVQDGNQFTLNTPVIEQNAVVPANTNAYTVTLAGVPIGIRVKMFGSTALNVTGSSTILLYSDLAIADTAPGTQIASIQTTPISVGVTPNASAAQFAVQTNASGQVRGRVSFRDANTFTYMSTFGWIDPRGQ